MTLYDTSPQSVIDLPADADHFTQGRAGLPLVFILLHHSGGVDSRAWLTWQSKPAVSCHDLIVKNGDVYKVVKAEDTAYCAGFGVVGPVDPDVSDPAGIARNLNFVSYNIELENMGTGTDPYPAVQMQSCALRIYEVWGKYGFLPILYHKHVDVNKNDPRGTETNKALWSYRPDLDRRLFLLLSQTNTDSNALRHLELAAGHIQAGLGDIMAAMAALR